MSKSGANQILDERLRQLEAEGWSANHDDAFQSGELVQAAIAYALATPKDSDTLVGGMAENTEAFAWWPWELRWWKPKDRISNLVRAGALIAAEIDRLQRLSGGVLTPDAPDGANAWLCDYCLGLTADGEHCAVCGTPRR